ncbi:MAG: class I SAM-dependent methyltransferase [Nitrososphaeraceae archaeon]
MSSCVCPPCYIKEIRKKVNTNRIKNIHVILTDCDTKLPDASIDVVLLFYVLHDFKNPDPILRELVRVIKPNGVLVVLDHKFDKDKVVSTISHATSMLNINNAGLKNGKSKSEVLLFLKQGS